MITLETLKENRTSIIASITEKAGAENVARIMRFMVNDLDVFYPNDSIEKRIDTAIEICQIPPSKTSVASMACEYQLNEGIKYNHIIKDFVKI